MRTPQSTRRRLLLGLGQALAGLVLTPSLPALALGPARQHDGSALHLGLLLPEHTALPTLAEDFSQGLRLGLAASFPAAEQRIRLHVDTYDARQSRAAVAAIRRLSERDELALAVGVVSPEAARQSLAQLTAANLPLLCCDSGANVAQPASAASASPYLSRLSLDYWQSLYRAGAWAAAHLGRRTVMAMSWRDSGYDFPLAFSHAFSAGGGEVLAQHVSFLPHTDQPFAGLADSLARQRPDFVCSLYVGQEAVQFADFWQRSGLSRRYPLLGGGLNHTLAPLAGTSAPILSAASWAPEPLHCSAFGEQCRQAGLLSPQARPYLLLGYEAAQRLSAAWQQAPQRGLPLAQALAATAVVSPRGWLRPTAAPDLGAAHWLRQGPQASLAASLPAVPVAADFLAAVHSPMRSGWSTPYLAA